MREPTVKRILTINTGSSSLKIAVYELGSAETRTLAGSAEQIGASGGHLRLAAAHGETLLDHSRAFADHGAALSAVLDWLRQHRAEQRPDAVGHRLVLGQLHHLQPERVTPEWIAKLQGMIPLAPDHLPQAIAAMLVAIKAYPDLPQVACSDSAFHQHMPRLAQVYPLPRHFADEGLIRYGFHGLSYEYVLHAVRVAAPQEADGRVIIAHLGNGASMAAVRAGIGIDTSMGFTPSGGLMMGTRAGDLDPGVLLYLLSETRMPPDRLNTLLNQQSGLLGVSATSASMRELLEKEAGDRHAAEAIALFCYLAKKQLGALAAVLGGLNTLVFTGGIGERAAPIRLRICQGLEFLGIQVDPERNEQHAPVISPPGSLVTVRVIPTDEDLMIARHTRELITKP